MKELSEETESDETVLPPGSRVGLDLGYYEGWHTRVYINNEWKEKLYHPSFKGAMLQWKYIITNNRIPINISCYESIIVNIDPIQRALNEAMHALHETMKERMLDGLAIKAMPKFVMSFDVPKKKEK